MVYRIKFCVLNCIIVELVEQAYRDIILHNNYVLIIPTNLVFDYSYL